MREIKFRAFDKNSKEMFHAVEQGISFDDGSKYDFHQFIEPLSHDIHDWALMQFTGLKDKNGKEIWESDIVHFVGGTTSALPCGNYADDVHRIGAKLKIVWLKSGWTLQPLSFDKHIPNMVGNVNNYDFWNYARSLEVIGDIHRNPELLK